jgi:pilus assembly protein TadC
MGLANILTNKHPELKKKISMAKLNMTPNEYMQGVVKRTVMSVIGMLLVIFIFFQNHEAFLFIFIISFILLTKFMYSLNLGYVDAKIRKRGKDIDKEVLFAGRFLLIKLNSGQPLINALFDASRSFGVANKYFKEIVRDIQLGTPLKKALDNASNYSASKRFKRILFQINNAIKIGIDVSDSLGAILDEIAEEQLIEIQRYGKKLNSLTMFYMLLAIILPSLGMTMAVVIMSMLPNMGSLANAIFWFFGFLVVMIQFMFIMMFKNARPNVNI